MRLRRRGLVQGYIKVPEHSKNGKQHLHVLFRGSYIDQAMLSQMWQEIHKAKIVDIRAVGYRRGKRGIAAYMAKYMSKENLYRYSWDWGWVWRGFCNDWKRLKRYRNWLIEGGLWIPYGKLMITWRLWLRGISKPYLGDMPENWRPG